MFGKLIEKFGLNQYTKEIESISLACFEGRPVDGDIDVGDSKAGGLPDVPRSFEWPCFRGDPLEFLVQIDCSDIDSPVLPENGILQFFYVDGFWTDQYQDKDFIRVNYVPVDSDISPREPPFVYKKRLWGLLKPRQIPKVYPEIKIEFVRAVSLPEIDGYPFEILNKFYNDDELLDGYCTLKSELAEPRFLQVGGYPNPVQFDGIAESAAKIMQRGRASDWNMILEINSLEGFMWGDAGKLHYFVHSDDLRSLQFSDVWMDMQCY